MKNQSILVLMYHYVREIKDSEFPHLRGVEFNQFKKQLDFIVKNYNVIRAEDLINFYVNGAELPDNTCLLTFDDGYKDHKKFVLPELLKRGLKGVFFPPVKSIIDRELLDANAIHFILSSENNDSQLLEKILKLCSENSIDQDIIDTWKKENYIIDDKFDSPNRILIKRLLQYLIPTNIRKKIISIMFKQVMGLACEEFADDFYLNKDDLKLFIDNGMYVGGHGYKHDRLSQLSYQEQKLDINKTIQFLKSINAPTKNWIMCYPYGDCNKNTIDILQNSECALAFKDTGGQTLLEKKKKYELARYDIKEFKL
jgi:peptidoglycan/xylan/chitin deacetylase (PgdA/CDA1 family)